MKKVLLIILFSLVTAMLFCEEYKSIEYNGTGYPASTSIPTLSVELNRDGNTLGFGFSSTDPKSTSGITNITEMPLSLSSKLNPNTGKITLIGSTSFYIWWQIKKPSEGNTSEYSFSVSKSGDFSYGEKSIQYTVKLNLDSGTKILKSNESKELDRLDTNSEYDENSIHSASYLVEINTEDVSGVPYGTILSSSIVLEVKTKI